MPSSVRAITERVWQPAVASSRRRAIASTRTPAGRASHRRPATASGRPGYRGTDADTDQTLPPGAPTNTPTRTPTITPTPSPTPGSACVCSCPGLSCVPNGISFTASDCNALYAGLPSCSFANYCSGSPSDCTSCLAHTAPPPTRTPTRTPVPRFVDNGNGTITDNQTGLTWEKKDDAGGIHDKDNSYTWSSTGTAADGTAFTSFLATLNTSPCFAGRCDRRLPTMAGCCGYPTGQAAELESILAAPYPCDTDPCVPVEFNTNCTPGCSATGFNCTTSAFYWSGSTISASPIDAWDVGFGNGQRLQDEQRLRACSAVRLVIGSEGWEVVV